MMKNKIWRITLDTNPEDCNLKCVMCEEHSPFSKFKEELFNKTGEKVRRMPKEWIKQLFKEAKELGVTEIIPSTMGEPLLYKDINLFFEYAREYDIKINLTTNGTFPKQSVKEWAKLIIPVTSDTKISINGVTKETSEKVMLGLDFDKQIENIREFVRYRDKHYKETGFYSRITLQLTFLQNNMHELSKIIELGANLGIDRIKGHHLWAHFDEIKTLSFKTSTDSIKKWNSIVDEAHIAVEKYLKPNGDKILLEQIERLPLNENKTVKEETNCPFLEKEVWISAKGKLSPCCAPDKERDTLGDFGTYPETSIKQMTESETYTNLVRTYKQHPMCKTCVMRK